MANKRLDVLLVERGLAESRNKAQALIMAGDVRVDGQVVDRPSAVIAPKADVTVDVGPRFVSRGGEKLDAALQAFSLDVANRICADVGASTGGFTDCLLQRGAEKVYAIDVGKGQLHWKLRTDRRVVVMEGTNARFIEQLSELISLTTIDASFISLKLLLPVVRNWFVPPPPSPVEGFASARSREKLASGDVVALIKPQFEAGRTISARGEGVIRDPAVHRQVLTEILSFAQKESYGVCGLIRSPLLGPKGNVEFLAWLSLNIIGSELSALIDPLFESGQPHISRE
jgi:23S rRNA (cytidine1920-2'-O)/16S rRNA (cytidine1409-2'-O)-methyltransferase